VFDRPAVRVRVAALCVAGLVCIAAGACSEKLRGGAACAALCPRENVTVRDTEFDGTLVLAMDTSIFGYPGFGKATSVLLATGSAIPSQPFDVRGIIRFDSVSFLFRPKPADSLRPTTVVDSAYVRLRIDTTTFASNGPITISAYDVDTVGFDTTTSVLASLFRPDRFLGSAILPTQASPKRDSLLIPLDSSRIRPHITGDKRVRLGLVITSPGPARVNIRSVSSGAGPQFSYRPSTDTGVAPFTDAPASLSPTTDSTLRVLLTNYPIVIAAPAAPPPTALAVGGLPTARAVVLFNLPSKIIDSATVVRATLTLHQQPLAYYEPSDVMTIYPQAVVSTGSVMDPGKVALFLASNAIVGIDSSVVHPATSDSANIEFVNAVRRWAGRGTDTVTRAIVLRVVNEGATTLGASFYSTAPGVPAAFQPHVHIAYVPRVTFGLP
jgi:hypothetical protein